MGWLGVFLVGLSGLVWGLGLEVGNPPQLASFGDSFIYLLQKATLQRPAWAGGDNRPGCREGRNEVAMVCQFMGILGVVIGLTLYVVTYRLIK